MAGPTKQTSGVRRMPSSLSKVSTPPSTSSSKQSKSSKPNLIVQLKLPKEYLSQFPHDYSSTGESIETKPISSSTTKPTVSTGSASSAPGKSESDASLSATGAGDENHSSDSKLKQGDTNNPKAGVKREIDAGVAGDEKPKPKPAQRKRPKV